MERDLFGPEPKKPEPEKKIGTCGDCGYQIDGWTLRPWCPLSLKESPSNREGCRFWEARK